MVKAHQARKRRRELLAAPAAVAALLRGSPRDCVPRKRLKWGVHKQTLLLEGQFERCYRMSALSFDKLLALVRPAVLRDELQSERRTDDHCLAGWEQHAHYTLPGWSVLVRLLRRDYRCDGCAALCQIRAPSAREVPDVAAFFSGHYQMYGLNVQAICDSLCRFTGYCFDSPGKVGDSIAFKKWSLSDEIMRLPDCYYIVGDNAYPLSDALLVPYTKVEVKTRKDSDFNFYLSQLRIRIEMSFGFLVNKW
ncbi:hypothetical protein F443_10667 [Phytophthora nicotianae P1569]|uniref:DDE Tnp4 domain-containing protein n=1 Tax=Phytophthora nicotianae P1569 TaxID=1317065 RepID=V9EZE0_PHYNI|nr:hypothetical protein F443_10667 [Phytophthora nicotianae P1569]